MNRIKQIVEDIRSKNTKPIYFLMGEEAYYIDKISDYIENNVLSEEEKGFNQMIRSPEYKLVWNAELDIDTLLFNIAEDPAELMNIYKDNEALAHSMFDAYASWEKELQPPSWPSVIHFAGSPNAGSMVSTPWISPAVPPGSIAR